MDYSQLAEKAVVALHMHFHAGLTKPGFDECRKDLCGDWHALKSSTPVEDKHIAFIRDIAQDRDDRVGPMVKQVAVALLKDLLAKPATIMVDGKGRAASGPYTGAQLREHLGIPDGMDLWLKTGSDDARIDESRAINIHGGERFYTAPQDINN